MEGLPRLWQGGRREAVAARASRRRGDERRALCAGRRSARRMTRAEAALWQPRCLALWAKGKRRRAATWPWPATCALSIRPSRPGLSTPPPTHSPSPTTNPLPTHPLPTNPYSCSPLTLCPQTLCPHPLSPQPLSDLTPMPAATSASTPRRAAHRPPPCRALTASATIDSPTHPLPTNP